MHVSSAWLHSVFIAVSTRTNIVLLLRQPKFLLQTGECNRTWTRYIRERNADFWVWLQLNGYVIERRFQTWMLLWCVTEITQGNAIANIN